MKRIVISALVLVTLGFVFNSCVKKKFDSPPDVSTNDPMLPVNKTIAQVKAKFGVSTNAYVIDSDWTVYGIVTADDRSGNFYKQITIEDSTGGITILIDAYDLYTKYPVGRKVYLHLKGLYYGYYAKLPQLGGVPDNTGSMSNIPGVAIDKYIVPANYPNQVPLTVYTGLSAVKNVNPAMLNRLVRLDSVEFVSSGDSTYAFPASISSGTSETIEDCNGNQIILRTSGYASFQSYKLPKGKGSITALYTVYNSTPQLVIRDTSDVKFYGDRCGANSNVPIITIDSLRKMYPGSGSFTIPSAKITAVVISDIDKGNASSGNFILEDASHKGIIMYISGSTAYKVGDSLVIDASGGALSLYPTTGTGQSMELTGITASKITKAATNRAFVPLTVTIAQLTANFSAYESTLVRVQNATIAGGGNFSGSHAMTDGTSGSISFYTASGASFATTPLPTTFPKTVQGIATPFGTGNEIKPRDVTDIY